MRLQLDPDGELLNELKMKKNTGEITDEELKTLRKLINNAYKYKYFNSEKGHEAIRRLKLKKISETGKVANQSTLDRFNISPEEIKECLTTFLQKSNF